MSFAPVDTSTSQGEPIELYILSAENLIYYYTNGPDDITALGVVFKSRQLRRTPITYNMSLLDTSNCDFYLPTTDAFAKKCLGLVTPTVLTVQIFQQHLTDPDAEAQRAHFGYIMDIDSTGNETRFKTGSLMQAYTSADVGVTLYSYNCNHELGDEHCGVDLDGLDPTGNPYRTLSTVDAIGAYAVSLTGLDGLDTSYYAGGTLINLRTGQRRPLINIDGDDCYILAPFADIVIGDPVKLWPGCDHKINGALGCKARFDNVINFGGFPFIPRKNPFVEGFGEINYTGGEMS